MDVADLQNLAQLFFLFIGGGLITSITMLVALIKCYKNPDLSRTKKWLWLSAQMIFMFPSYLYLILEEKSWFWKVAGLFSTLITIAIIAYMLKNSATLPDFSTLGLPSNMGAP